MKLKDRIKIAIGSALTAIGEQRNGVANKADPTAWESITFKFHVVCTRVRIVISSMDEPVAHLYVNGRERMFVSSLLNRKWHWIVKFVDDCVFSASNADLLEMYDLDWDAFLGEE
jgi:hypothetical protein